METSIDSLRNSSLSSDDSRLVDSILSDLNGSSGPQQNQMNQGPMPNQQQQGPMPNQHQQQQQQQPSPGPQGQMTPEQQKMMLEQRQQQIMMQQQMAAQQQRQQQANVLKNQNVSILDDLKKESGKLFLILILSILIHSNIGDTPFNLYPDTFLVPDGTNLNMSAITIKSVIMCLSFYGIHKVLFN